MGKKYEQLYAQLYEMVLRFHNGNRKRLKRGVLAYLILPVVLIIVRALTDSDKTFFLIVWIFGMFIISGILIGIEYMDYRIINALNEYTDRDVEFDNLVEIPRADLPERVRTRIAERKKEAKDE